MTPMSSSERSIDDLLTDAFAASRPARRHPSIDDLVLYEADALDPATVDVVRAHLVACSACRATVLELADARAVMDQAEAAPAPAALADGLADLRARLAAPVPSPAPAVSPAPAPMTSSPRPVRLQLMAAMLAAAVLGLAYWNLGLRHAATEHGWTDNVLSATLEPVDGDAPRGPGALPELRIPRSARQVVFDVPSPDLGQFASYRLSLYRDETPRGAPIHVWRGLERPTGRPFTVGAPAEALQGGLHLLVLEGLAYEGLDGATVTTLSTYRVAITHEGR